MGKNKINRPILFIEKDISNKQKFAMLEQHWASVRLGYIREIPNDVKNEIERIYKEELEPTWLPNKYCKACYFTAIERLIRFFEL